MPERELLAHIEGCKMKADGPVRFFEYATAGQPIEGPRYVREIAPPSSNCDGTHVDGFPCPDCLRPAEVIGFECDPQDQTVQTASLEETMAKRNARYGDFKVQARIGKAIRFAMRLAPNWNKLTPSQELALDWISDKIARILCGDTSYSDNWHDIAGYANLGERDCGPASV